MLLYNIPPCTHNPFLPETVAALARDPRVIGIKDSAGDAAVYRQFIAIKRDRPAFRAGGSPCRGASTAALRKNYIKRDGAYCVGAKGRAYNF